MSLAEERPGLARWAGRTALAFLSLAVALAAAARPRRVVVVGPSMEPTLLEGDHLLVAHRGQAKAGDVVALRDPTNPKRVIVKRITAVRRDEVIVRGDNPSASVDSRSFGPVPKNAVLGTVIRRYSPSARAGKVR